MKKFKLTERHYRQGRMYEPGEEIEVEDSEKPGKSWQLMEEKPEKKSKAEK